ncbi:MAG: VCBS repeat-containing protein [Myxococcota bacterium]
MKSTRWMVLLLSGCTHQGDTGTNPTQTAETARYLPAPRIDLVEALGPCMDAELADLDEDGDLDVVLAFEFDTNTILWNDGDLNFTPERLPKPSGIPPQYLGADSEDIAIIDVDGDEDLDLLFVAEDLGGIDELYLWEDGAFGVSDALPAPAITNGLDTADLDGDGLPEVILAQKGQNAVWSADGQGGFVDVTADWLPEVDDSSQDAELADLDGDGDLDLVFANEGGDNRVLFNDGRAFIEGVFPTAPAEETREIDAGDLDGDGDLDLVIANVGWGVGPPQDRVLFNAGDGTFVEGASTLPEDGYNTLDVDLVDLDDDGDLDVLRANSALVSNRLVEAPFEAWINDGAGGLSMAGEDLLVRVDGKGLDVEVGDLNGDGLSDLYYCVLGGRDVVMIQQP